MLSGWFAELSGTVFNDLNENGRQDPGEPGIPGFPVIIKTRNNSIEDQGSQISLTDIAGHYNLNQAYPLNQFNVLEAYADGWKTTGVTYQTDNQPTPTTELGAGVDVSFLPIIGLSGRLDWGVKPYAAGDNGGIVGTVSYGTTRNEVDPSQAAVEDYQPGIPGLQVDLFKPVACDANTPAASCSPDGYVLAADGSYALGDWINRYQTESWQRPKNCTARTVTGDPLVGEQALPRTTDPLGNPVDCIEAPMMGIQFGGDDPFNSPKPRCELLQLGGRQLRLRRRLDDAGFAPARRLARPGQPGLRLGDADPGRLHRQGRDPERPDPAPPALHADPRRGRQRLQRRLVQAGVSAAALRRRAAHGARDQPGLHRRGRQPLRWPAAPAV